jgi:phosphohistidine phosphatase
MKQLTILRHAKSSRDDPALADIDRPLSNRGRKAGPAIGAFIADAGLVPRRVLCSTAQRTRETYALVNEAWGRSVPVEFLPALYLADAAEIVALLRDLPDDADRVMVIGHNPGLERLADMLAANRQSPALARLRSKFPTGGLAAFELDIDHWRALGPRCGRMTQFKVPRDLD